VNELLQNAFEHAFGQRPRGKLRSGSPRRTPIGASGRRQWQGLPEGFDPREGSDLGLKIVHALVTEDLSGTLTFSGGPGTRAVITVPKVEFHA